MKKSGLIFITTLLSIVLLLNSYPVSAAENTLDEAVESTEKEPEGGSRGIVYINGNYSTVCTAHGCNNRFSVIGLPIGYVVDIRMVGYDGSYLWTGSGILNSGTWTTTLWTGTDVSYIEARVRNTSGGYATTVTLSVETNV